MRLTTTLLHKPIIVAILITPILALTTLRSSSSDELETQVQPFLGFYYDGTCAEAEARRADLESIKAGWGKYIENFLDEYRYDDGYLLIEYSYGGPPRVITIVKVEGDILAGRFTAPADGNVWQVIIQLVDRGLTEFYPKTKKHIEDIRESFPEFQNDADFHCRID